MFFDLKKHNLYAIIAKTKVFTEEEMILYFSGTGNSRYCAQAFANALQDVCCDSFDYLKKNENAELHSEKPWVFCAPTYAWQLPHLFADFIRSSLFSGSQEAYFVLTCGDDVGNAGILLDKLCKLKGLHYRGILEVVMPENYIAMFSVPKPHTQKKIIGNAEPSIQNGIACIKNGVDFPAYKASFVQKIKTHVVNPLFYALCVKANDFYATDACVGCGKCEKLCVCNNIRIENCKPVWGQSCTHCMACICRCPQEAIEYADKSQGKPRYVCPQRKTD